MNRSSLFHLVVAITVAFLLRPHSGAAQDLSGDRPDFTESTLVVPQGFVQLEAGITYESQAGGNVDIITAGEALVRFPVSRVLELRLGAPSYRQVDSVVSREGLTDASVGLKYSLGDITDGLNAAVLGSLSLPTGNDEISSESLDPSAIFILSHDASENLSISGQVGADLPEVRNEREFNVSATLVAGYALNNSTGVFTELAGLFPQQGDADAILHAGLTRLIHDNLQVDLHGGLGLTGPGTDGFIGFGFVYRR